MSEIDEAADAATTAVLSMHSEVYVILFPKMDGDLGIPVQRATQNIGFFISDQVQQWVGVTRRVW